MSAPSHAVESAGPQVAPTLETSTVQGAKARASASPWGVPPSGSPEPPPAPAAPPVPAVPPAPPVPAVPPAPAAPPVPAVPPAPAAPPVPAVPPAPAAPPVPAVPPAPAVPPEPPLADAPPEPPPPSPAMPPCPAVPPESALPESMLLSPLEPSVLPACPDVPAAPLRPESFAPVALQPANSGVAIRTRVGTNLATMILAPSLALRTARAATRKPIHSRRAIWARSGSRNRAAGYSAHPACVMLPAVADDAVRQEWPRTPVARPGLEHYVSILVTKEEPP